MMPRGRTIVTVLAPLISLSLIGCGGGTPPSAGVSDFGVFTTPHLIAAEVGVETTGDAQSYGNGPFTDAEMRRYFETPAADYEKEKVRMDMLLDGVQRQSAMFQAAQSSFVGSLAVTFAKALAAATQPTPAPTPPAATAPTTPPDPQLIDEFKTVFTQLLAAPVSDSPFDQLDRVTDFYAAYVIKKLRVRGDSRTIDNDTLEELVLAAVPDAKREDMRKLIDDLKSKPEAQDSAHGSRLLLVVFQTHVFQGNVRDVWTGTRIKITSAGPNEHYRAADVKVIRLHPTHTYDVDQVTFGQSAQRSFALAGQGTASVPTLGIGVSAQAQGAEEEQERQKYLSRISKTASFADAGENMFGFNFYPSNVRVDRTYIPFGLLFTGQATTYATHGYLESGGRDCAAILVVPRGLKSFTCKVRSVWGKIDDGIERGETDGNAGREFVVTLPDWNGLELAAATIGAGPTTHAASHRGMPSGPTSVPTTQPTTGQK
jgi:hypothetical protein